MLIDSQRSMLIPAQYAPEWTDFSKILCDELPGVAGTGAVQIAQQALNISPQDAAALVASQGGTNTTVSSLTTAAGNAQTSAIQSPAQQSRNSLGGRLPIPPSVATATALLNGDPNRAFLLFQNNNAAAGANLLVNIDGPVDTGNPQYYLNILPGNFGLLIDQNVMVNPVYVAWGAGAVVGGMLMYGSFPTNTAVRSGNVIPFPGPAYRPPVLIGNPTAGF